MDVVPMGWGETIHEKNQAREHFMAIQEANALRAKLGLKPLRM